jgi:hypothetical protein
MLVCGGVGGGAAYGGGGIGEEGSGIGGGGLRKKLVAAQPNAVVVQLQLAMLSWVWEG